MVKQLKMLKNFVKFQCWFGAMLLMFGLVSVRRVITCVCAVGHPACQDGCVDLSVVQHASSATQLPKHVGEIKDKNFINKR
jgi:hypothetical protein